MTAIRETPAARLPETLTIRGVAEALGVPSVTVQRLTSDLCAEWGPRRVVAEALGMSTTVLTPAGADEIALRVRTSGGVL